MKPISLEIVTKVITIFGRFGHFDLIFNETGVDKKFYQKELNEYPSDLKEDLSRLFHWIRDLKRLYKHRLLIKLIDAQSLLGIYKSIRHRIRRYPAFIVEGKEIYSGWNRDQLEGLIDKYIKASFIPKHDKNLWPKR